MNRVLEEDIRTFAGTFALADDYAGKTIAVTGATGLLGSITTRCLLAIGAKVVAVVRSREKAERVLGMENDRMRFFTMDFATDGYSRFSRMGSVDAIIHYASPTASKYFVEHPVETICTVVDGTRTVLEYGREHKQTRIVLVSTLEVYGTVTDDSHALTEADQGYLNPMSARSSYPMAKRLAECLCHAAAEEEGVSVMVVRLAQTFGAGVAPDDQRVFAQFARSITNKQDIVLHTRGELCRCYCYTTDAISALLFILLKGEQGEAYNVANEQTYISIMDMARMVCKEFNPEVKPVVELKDGMGYSAPTKLRLSAAKTMALGWRPHYDLKEMFARLIEAGSSPTIPPSVPPSPGDRNPKRGGSSISKGGETQNEM